MPKIKVLHISQAAGGVQRHVIDIISRIDRNSFEVAGVCPPKDLVNGASTEKESFLDAFKRVGVRSYPIKMRRQIRPIDDLVAFLRIYNFIRNERFDVVHTHSSKAGFLGRIAARLAGVPVIVHTPNNFAFDRPGYMIGQRVFYALLEKFAGLFCDKVIAVSEDEKRLAVNPRVVPSDKIIVIGNAVETMTFNLNVDAAQKKAQIGVGAKDRLVVFIGRMAPQKAPLDFVYAAGEVLGVFQDVKFLMLGDGPLSKEVSDIIRKNKLSDFIKLLGWRNDARDIIAISDIFAISSLWEGCNYSILDAAFLGKPIVATDVSGAREMIIDGYNGFVVPKARPRLLAEAILRLLRLDGHRLSEFGRHSREIFERRPGLSETVKRTEELYKGLLCTKKG